MSSSVNRVIWQYWETRGTKPAFVDGLLEIARKNAGVPIIQVTPETLPEYLPDLEPEILELGELAHKADMIRSRLVARYGGMWLDSDAIVLKDLSFLFDHLEQADFVGFNRRAQLTESWPWIRINCFAARKNSVVASEWAAGQSAKLSKRKFRWEEVGTGILHPVCLRHRDIVKVLPFEWISPVPAKRVARFGSRWRNPGGLLDKCSIVMLSNKLLESNLPRLREMTVDEIGQSDIYVSHFIRKARDPSYRAPSQLTTMLRGLTS